MDEKFVLGKLTSAVENLDKKVCELCRTTDTLSRELNEIKLFRAKVMGAAIVASAITSVLGAAAMKAVELWAR